MPLESLYFQAVEWLCAQIVTEIKSVKHWLGVGSTLQGDL
jgi:hypothetical protein